MTDHAQEPMLDGLDEQSPELYRVAMQTLRIGFLIAAALFVAGYLAVEISGGEFSHRVTPIDQLPGELLDGEPMAVLDLAFLLLILTPVVTVLRLALVFHRLGERRFALASAAVLGILLTSIVIALVR
ncbi:MAG: DUF1634 domain-containing protein [Thermomicrobiales bacterium]|nr:DUF1634 domain-containing protein [Thermomicrobiales bacterium]